MSPNWRTGLHCHRITTKWPSRYRKGQDTTFTLVAYELWLPFPPGGWQ